MLLLAVLTLVCAQDAPDEASSRLVYDAPANAWTEALPVGNGRLGAMVFGGVAEERLQLNEDSIWAGAPLVREREGGPGVLARSRALLFAGSAAEAQALLQERFLSERLVRSYQTLGDLHLSLDLPGEIEDYERSLDLDTAVAITTWSSDGVRYRREVYAGAPDQVIVVHLASEPPVSMTGRVRLSRPADAQVQAADATTLTLTGRATQGGAHPGVSFEARVLLLPAPRVGSESSKVESPDTLTFSSEGELTLLVACRTDYGGGEISARLAADLQRARRQPLEQLRADHVREHRRLFRRVALDLGRAEGIPRTTDARLARLREGGLDPELFALYFQFGRYLLISSSRPGGLPANLQGLWNEHIEAPWNSDYHVNINLQMNYWPAEVTNLAECTEPLWDFMDGLRARGAVTARELYGLPGWVAHHTSDAWHFTVPTGRTVWGLWPLGGAWMTRHLWEHYEFSGDRDFLALRAWPALEGAARFFLDYLVEDPRTGLLVAGPMSSPENTYRLPDGSTADVDMGPAMAQQVIWDLFSNVLAAAEILGEEQSFAAQVAAARGRLAPTVLGADGRLLEWSQPFEEAEPGHRHMSHLYALHPGQQITPRESPELAAAARASLDERLARGGGHTGWSRAWLVNLCARLLDGESAAEHLRLLLERSTLPNLFDNHPPFQIDGNFGGTAGLAEMLIQSHTGEIELLPAWPAAWKTGSVRGLRARGGFELEFDWREGEPYDVLVRATRDAPLRLRWRDEVLIRTQARAGEVYRPNLLGRGARLDDRLVPFERDTVQGLQPEMLAGRERGDYSLTYRLAEDEGAIRTRFLGPSEALSTGLAIDTVPCEGGGELVASIPRSDFAVVLARWWTDPEGRLLRGEVRTEPLLEIRPRELQPGQLSSDCDWRPWGAGRGIGPWRR